MIEYKQLKLNMSYSDLENVVRLADMFFKHAKMDRFGFRFDIESAVNYTSAIAENPSYCIFLAKDKDAPVGLMIGFIGPWMLDASQFVAHEQIWTVDPKYHGKGIGKKLFELFVAWAKRSGATHISAPIIKYEGKNDVDEMLKKNGFSELETNYMKEV